ncbi:restriction endonuclease [Spongiibacter marinus]|uniref:restriction endonuclease n=1 Tax=Spongiibacter marinus TaxID=354246 RepID=UPI0035BE6227
MDKSSLNWRDYEIYIHKHFERLFPEANIQHDVKREGIFSKTQRQIDILIEGKIAGFPLTIVVDCKYFSKKVDVKQVESFLSFLADLKVSKGVLITNGGYTDAAFNRATYDAQDVELRIIDFSDLEQFQDFSAIIWRGSSCAYLPAPPGWVIDADVFGEASAAIVPAGYASREAFSKDGFIYVIFSKKDKNLPTVRSLMDMQESRLKKQYPNATFEYFEPQLREEPVVLRVAEIDESYSGPEFTYFIDFGWFVLFLVLLCPRDKSEDYPNRLKWVVERVRAGEAILDHTGKPISIKFGAGGA